MLTSMLLFLMAIWRFNAAQDNCIFTDNGFSLDLSIFYKNNITITGHKMAYTPCKNGITCGSPPSHIMFALFQDFGNSNYPTCFSLTTYKSTVKPTLLSVYGGYVWKFEYIDGNYKTNVYWSCRKDISDLYKITEAGVSEQAIFYNYSNLTITADIHIASPNVC
mmetsp:Transcript_28695/g.35166  ORF Transcript_28695/g.35166 Transcript_28695/m.35166 type:complete len:164 (-) Transcript_28695:95-586(-)